MIFINVIILAVILIFNQKIKSVIANYSDWEPIETLAEEYPYVAAVLNHAKDFMCTGTVINKRVVLTSGRCISPEPHYVTVGNAIYTKNHSNNNSMFEVNFSKLHPDYIFGIKEDLSISHIHSNIGLIFTVRPLLDYFIESATIENYFAPELKGKKLLVVGYGNIKESGAVVLQQQMYHQIPCKNPKWYYCVCGIEYLSTYEEPFGEGAPVLYNGVVVGIAASPTRTLTLNTNINYNIFTVIGPYLPWIEKSMSLPVLEFKQATNGVWQTKKYEKHVIVIINVLIMFSK